MNEKVEPKSKALGQNPKDLLGVKKPSLSKIPAIAMLWESVAMMDGSGKYGAYNWRDNKVVASVYVDALLRHVLAWWEGQQRADDSHVHHLGHARACAGILLDAEATGNLIDDRPVAGGSAEAYQKALADVLQVVEHLQESHKEFHKKKAANAAG